MSIYYVLEPHLSTKCGMHMHKYITNMFLNLYELTKILLVKDHACKGKEYNFPLGEGRVVSSFP